MDVIRFCGVVFDSMKWHVGWLRDGMGWYGVVLDGMGLDDIGWYQLVLDGMGWY